MHSYTFFLHCCNSRFLLILAQAGLEKHVEKCPSIQCWGVHVFYCSCRLLGWMNSCHTASQLSCLRIAQVHDIIWHHLVEVSWTMFFMDGFLTCATYFCHQNPNSRGFHNEGRHDGLAAEWAMIPRTFSKKDQFDCPSHRPKMVFFLVGFGFLKFSWIRHLRDWWQVGQPRSLVARWEVHHWENRGFISFLWYWNLRKWGFKPVDIPSGYFNITMENGPFINDLYQNGVFFHSYVAWGGTVADGDRDRDDCSDHGDTVMDIDIDLNIVDYDNFHSPQYRS